MKRLLFAILLAVTAQATHASQGASRGEFVGEVVSRWLDEGRLMELIEDFFYIDPSGRRWAAPKGSKVDGASIPRALWTAVGGPFEGQYRKASVLHDVACALKKDPWQKVHRMFYDAMLCAGVGETRALAMYTAVDRVGPRWNEAPSALGRILGGIFGAQGDTPPPPQPPDDVLEQFELAIREQGITTPEAAIEKLGR